MTLRTTLRTTSLTLAAGTLSMAASIANADIQHLDDVIITFSLCVGNDCVNGENFGFDTLRLKENNTRMHFDDTSNSASFPQNDWRLIANDSSNGGANYFAIEDATAGRIPFRVEAGAPIHTLYVESDGDVGIKTANPVVDLHIVEGNTPTVRLEQDGSDGFTAQTYDIAANESNFFIRDVTNASKLFFRAKPGAPEDSIFIAADGDIGLGTDAPDGPFHIRNNSAYMTLHDADNNDKWFITHAAGDDGSLEFTNQLNNGAFTVGFIVQPDGDTRLTGNLGIADGAAAAPATEAGKAVIYVDGADGDLKVKFGDGTTRVLAAD